MPDEAKKEVEETTVEYTDDEVNAMKHGWKPKEEYDGPPDNWRSAREFNERGELYERINSQSKQIDTLKRSVDQMAVHERKRYDTLLDQEIQRLNNEKVEAYRNEEFERIPDIDNKINEKRQEQQQAQQVDTTNQMPQEDISAYQAWTANNSSWYGPDIELTVEADNYFDQFTRSFPGRSLKEGLEFVDKKMRSKVTKPNKDIVLDTETTDRASSSGRGKSKKPTVANLSPEQKEIMNGYVRSKIMTEQEYIDELVAIGEL